MMAEMQPASFKPYPHEAVPAQRVPSSHLYQSGGVAAGVGWGAV